MDDLTRPTDIEATQVAYGLFLLVGPHEAAEHLIAIYGWDRAFQTLIAMPDEQAATAAWAAITSLRGDDVARDGSTDRLR